MKATNPTSETNYEGYLVPIKEGDAFRMTTSQDLLWPELQAIFDTFKITTPLLFVPPEPFIGGFALATANACGVPLTVGSVYQPVWAVEAFQALAHDCCITDAEVAAVFLKKLKAVQDLTCLKVVVLVGVVDAAVVTEVQALCGTAEVRTIDLPF